MTKPLLFSLLLALLVACAPNTQTPDADPTTASQAQAAEPATEPATGPAAEATAEPEAEAPGSGPMALGDDLRRYPVVYEVEVREGPDRSPCSANVTLRAQRETLQFVEVAATGSPWRYGTDAEPGSLVYVSAQTNCGGEVIVRLYLDGELFRQASNAGRFAVATVRRVY